MQRNVVEIWKQCAEATEAARARDEFVRQQVRAVAEKFGGKWCHEGKAWRFECPNCQNAVFLHEREPRITFSKRGMECAGARVMAAKIEKRVEKLKLREVNP